MARHVQVHRYEELHGPSPVPPRRGRGAARLRPGSPRRGRRAARPPPRRPGAARPRPGSPGRGRRAARLRPGHRPNLHACGVPLRDTRIGACARRTLPGDLFAVCSQAPRVQALRSPRPRILRRRLRCLLPGRRAVRDLRIARRGRGRALHRDRHQRREAPRSRCRSSSASTGLGAARSISPRSCPRCRCARG
jgi:hypothetical protein